MPQGIELSNLGKVLWPEAGLTKGDLIDYCQAVAPMLLPSLRQRPLTVKRYPDGVDGFGFYQKNTPAYAPEWIPTATYYSHTAKRDVRYTLCNSSRALRWLANQATVEFHPWLSRIDHIDRPDHLVLDLDPPEGDFERAAAAALLAREVLAEVGLQGAAKTSGSKGVHVFVPLQRRYPYEQVREAANELANRMVQREPDLVTTAFARDARGGRVYVDAGRVAPGAHCASVYSPRARPSATVSFPVSWSRLARAGPEEFNLKNVPGILNRRGDVWQALLPRPQPLPRGLR